MSRLAAVLDRLLRRAPSTTLVGPDPDPGPGPFKFIPRDGGFFSSFNFLVGEMHQGRRLYPLYSSEEVRRLHGTVRHFAYLDPACPNAWFEFFEPLVYEDGDTLHTCLAEVSALPTSSGLRAAPEFRIPAASLALYRSADFPAWRRAVHAGVAGRIRPVAAIRAAVESLLAQMPGPRIGVHVRHPSHLVEQGRIFFSDYFAIIDRLLEAHPSASLFLATDNDLALAAFAQRYPGRLCWHDGFLRESIDDVLAWAYSLTTGQADAMGFVSGVGFQTHYKAAAAGAGAQGLRCGREAVIDLYTLAACDDFICTTSNFTLSCAFLNPDQRLHLVSAGPPTA